MIEDTMPKGMKKKRLHVDEIGVDGSTHRRLHDLMVKEGSRLISVYRDDLETGVSMVFDEDKHCFVTVSIVHSLKAKEAGK